MFYSFSQYRTDAKWKGVQKASRTKLYGIFRQMKVRNGPIYQFVKYNYCGTLQDTKNSRAYEGSSSSTCNRLAFQRKSEFRIYVLLSFCKIVELWCVCTSKVCMSRFICYRTADAHTLSISFSPSAQHSQTDNNAGPISTRKVLRSERGRSSKTIW